MINSNTALNIILKHTKQLGVEKIPLHECFGRVLAESICSDMDIPPFDRSAMDGFAINSNDSSEAFIVIEGNMTIEFRDGSTKLSAGEMVVVPKGVEHKPRAEKGCSVLVFEPSGVVNTGDSGGKLTAPSDVWI